MREILRESIHTDKIQVYFSFQSHGRYDEGVGVWKDAIASLPPSADVSKCEAGIYLIWFLRRIQRVIRFGMSVFWMKI